MKNIILILALVSIPTTAEAATWAQFALGGGYEAVLIVSNKTAQPWSGNIKAYQGFNAQWTGRWFIDGAESTGSQSFPFTLAPQGTRKFRFTGDATTRSGYLDLSPGNGYSANDISYSFFYEVRNDGDIQESIGGPESSVSKQFLFAVERTAKVNTGYAICTSTRDSAVPFSIVLTIYDQSGLLYRTKNITYQGQVATFVSQVFEDLPADFIGSMRIESQQYVYLTVMRMEYNSTGWQFTCIPPNVLGPTSSTTYRHLLIVYLNTDVTYQKDGQELRYTGSMSENLKNNVVNAFLQLADLIDDGSAGAVKTSVSVVEISKPITKITVYSGNNYWLGDQDITSDLSRFAPAGKYDSVHVIWNNGPIDAYWGLEGIFINSGTTTFSSIIAGQDFWWGAQGGQVFLHEWLHAVCNFYQSLGYSMPERNADGAELHGYSNSSTEGWMQYYRDLMRGRVWEPTLAKYTGITREAWERGTPGSRK